MCKYEMIIQFMIIMHMNDMKQFVQIKKIILRSSLVISNQNVLSDQYRLNENINVWYLVIFNHVD